jgi:hypothetical protein
MVGIGRGDYQHIGVRETRELLNNRPR